MTSHDVVSRVRRKTGIKKVGHTGTLDPNAAGVLPICIGQATKISQYLLDSKKTYRAELTLGIKTDTQDIYGTVLETKHPNVSQDLIEETILSFMGEYNQIPPMYSALKVKGKKLYELARDGIEVKREPRKLTIYNIDIISIGDCRVLFDVTCSKGTYIRTLCHDIGELLGCGGVMSFLLRTESSDFSIHSAITLEEMQDTEDIKKILRPIDYPLKHIAKINLDNKYKNLALNGNKIFLDKVSLDDSRIIENNIVRIYLEQEFIGIGEIKKDTSQKFYIKFSRLFT